MPSRMSQTPTAATGSFPPMLESSASVAPIFLSLYRYAWFVGFALAFFIYLALRALTGSRASAKVVILSAAKDL